jgi:hypothetical protein
MALTGQRIATSKIVSGVSPTRNSGERPKSGIVAAVRAGGAMTDFLKGASWGAWFVLAGIIAAGLWAFVH